MEIDKYAETQNRKDKATIKGCLGGIAVFFAIILLLLMFYGCTTTRYIPVETWHTDTLLITKLQRDSIWLHDSVFIKEFMQGDTMYVLRDRWHTKYIESVSHDTTYISKTDTIPTPYPVEVEVERQLTWWQKFRISIANIILLFLLIYGIVFALRTYYKKFL